LAFAVAGLAAGFSGYWQQTQRFSTSIDAARPMGTFAQGRANRCAMAIAGALTAGGSWTLVAWWFIEPWACESPNRSPPAA